MLLWSHATCEACTSSESAMLSACTKCHADVACALFQHNQEAIVNCSGSVRYGLFVVIILLQIPHSSAFSTTCNYCRKEMETGGLLQYAHNSNSQSEHYKTGKICYTSVSESMWPCTWYTPTSSSCHFNHVMLFTLCHICSNAVQVKKTKNTHRRFCGLHNSFGLTHNYMAIAIYK